MAVSVSCKNAAEAKKDIDSLGDKVEKRVDDALNSELADSIRSKGAKVLKDVKDKSREAWTQQNQRVES